MKSPLIYYYVISKKNRPMSSVPKELKDILIYKGL